MVVDNIFAYKVGLYVGILSASLFWLCFYFLIEWANKLIQYRREYEATLTDKQFRDYQIYRRKL